MTKYQRAQNFTGHHQTAVVGIQTLCNYHLFLILVYNNIVTNRWQLVHDATSDTNCSSSVAAAEQYLQWKTI